MRFGGVGSALAMAGCLGLAALARADAPAKAPPPDDSFLEFLGQDDVEDAKWWEFFRRPVQHDRDESDRTPPDEDETQ